MNKSKLTPLIWISILFYILACCMPAYVEARNPALDWTASTWTEYRDYPGIACLFDGLLLPIGLLMGYWGTAVWFANAYYFCALFILLFSSKRRLPIILSCAILSIIIGSTLMFFSLHYITKDYCCWIVSLLSGYYLWILSFIALFIGLLAEYLPKSKKRWFSLIYGVGMIPVCLCIIANSFDKGDNSIMFDDDSQNLVANKSLDAIIINDGTHEILLKRQEDSGRTIPLQEIYSIFAPLDLKATPIKLHENNIYEIYNVTHVRAPMKKVRIEIEADGNAKSVEIPKEEGDNSFYFDQESQCLVTESYFGGLVIEYEKHLYWLDGKGLKRNKIPIKDLDVFFSESNDSILPLKPNQTYIINNRTHGNKSVHRIMIRLNENSAVDSISYLKPKDYI